MPTKKANKTKASKDKQVKVPKGGRKKGKGGNGRRKTAMKQESQLSSAKSK